VLTWDPSGGYGHPDHLAVHRHATAAFEQETVRPGGPRALYYMTLPVHLFARLEAELAAQGIQFGSDEIRERARDLPRLAVTTEIDVADCIPAKMKSGEEHRTQLPSDSPFQKVSGELRQLIVGIEYFHRAVPPWTESEPVEHGFWTGGAGG
jgi:mycothiol S-conjugate amidase